MDRIPVVQTQWGDTRESIRRQRRYAWRRTSKDVLARPSPPTERQAMTLPCENGCNGCDECTDYEADEIERCACGYPMPCGLTVPVGFCRQPITPAPIEKAAP